MNEEAKKQKRKKRLFKILLVVLGVITLCCVLSTVVAVLSALGEEDNPTPTRTPAPSPTATVEDVPTLTPTEVQPTPTRVPPTPTEVPEVPQASLDFQYLMDVTTCFDQEKVVPALSVLGDALSEDPPDLVAFCVGVPALQLAVAQSQTCWAGITLPVHPDLLEEKRLFEASLVKQVQAADLFQDFCTTGDWVYLDLANEALEEGHVLMGQAMDALDRYNVPGDQG